MRKLFIVMMIIGLSIGLIGSVSAAANDVPSFKVNGRLFVTPKGEPAPYFNKDYRTMASLRLIGEAIGIESKDITWNSTTQTASLTRGKQTVSLTLGKKEMKVNGKTVVMDTVAEQKQGRIFIPVKFIAEGLGIGLEFDAATNTVHFITDRGAVVNNNFEEFGLVQKEQLPLTLEANGLSITYHEIFVYETTDEEVQAIAEKFNIVYLEPKYSSHLVFMKVTIENNTDRAVQPWISEIEDKIRVYYNSNYQLRQATGKNYNNAEKDGDYLMNFRLEPGETITGYIGYTKDSDMTEPIVEITVMTVHKEVLNPARIARKE